MKPFDIKKALAGKPVVTRAGHKVTQIAYFEHITEGYSVYFSVENVPIVLSSTPDGHFRSCVTSESIYDLFMESQEQTLWTNIYTYSPESSQLTVPEMYLGTVYYSEEEAVAAGKQVDSYVKTISFKTEL